MAKRKLLEPAWQAVVDLASGPAVDRLPATVPAERRHHAARHALLCRIYGEFEEMPGLSLTPDQAARLFGLPPDVASRILGRLTDAHVLRQKRDGRFALRVEES